MCLNMFSNKAFIFITTMILSLIIGCSNNGDPDPVNCNNPPDITVDSTTPTSSCTSSDGVLIVTGSGKEPLEFSIEGVANSQTSGTFNELSAGVYTVIVTDVNGCSAQLNVTIDPAGTDLVADVSTSADTQCFDNNGIIEIQAAGGESPYQYNIGEGFSEANIFNNLGPGEYEVEVQDGVGCMVSVIAEVPKGDTGTSYENDINPIMTSSCAITGCHNGDNGANLDFTDFSLLQSKADLVKLRTQNGSMPPSGSLTEEEIALISCWVDEGAKDN